MPGVPLKLNREQSWIVLDQIRTIDRKMRTNKMGSIGVIEIGNLRQILREYLVDWSQGV